jgi:UDP-2,4-diacetamido-2,4,6-trideoxy-beta-L-altropyranose hydrolase
MRCLTLADSLQKQGADVVFICAGQPGHLGELIANRGFPARLLHSKGGAPGDEWLDDAVQTRAVLEGIEGRKVDWLVVDHYQLDHRWEAALRVSVERIMVIDDLCNRAHDCDLLLDQNLVAGMSTRYAGLVPKACRMLVGPRFALLAPGYAEVHEQMEPRKGPVQRILAFFGGVDSANLSSRAIEAFLAADRPDVHMDVVLGASNPHQVDVLKRAAGHANIQVHASQPSLAPLLLQADMALGAGGVTHWERLCLGLPSLVVTLADNQRAVTQELHRLGLVEWLGHHDEVDAKAIASALKMRLEAGFPAAWSLQCMATVDGRGVGRVVAALTAQPETAMRARLATLEDEKLLLDWANDPLTRQNAFSNEPIAAASHAAWLRRKLDDAANTRLYIAEQADGQAVGQVRFDRVGLAWEIDYAVAPALRGRRLGGRVLQVALASLAADETGSAVLGWVKEDNLASVKVFESLGFERVEVPARTPQAVGYRLNI